MDKLLNTLALQYYNVYFNNLCPARQNVIRQRAAYGV